MQQTLLNFDHPTAAPIVPRRPATLEERFRRFVGEHPEVPRQIIELARSRKRSGYGSWSMRAAFEVLRERRDLAIGLETVGGGHRVKIDNSYCRPMARLVMELAPDLAGFFRTR